MVNESNQSQIEFQADESGKSGVLYLRGDLTIQQSNTVATALVDALNKNMTLRLNLKELHSIDLIIIQSLFAAFQFAQKKSLAFEMDGECPQVFINAVQAAGLHFHAWLCFERTI